MPLTLFYGQEGTGSLLIKNGTVLTITNGVIESGDILIRNGKIAQVAAYIPEEAGVRIIDARGKYIMPGIIDAHSHLGINTVNEATNPVTAEVWVGDVVDPYDVGIYRALAGGVTTSHAMHGSANVIGGQCQTIKHRWGMTNPMDLIMEGAPRTIKFALGENPMRVHGEGKGVVPASRMGVEDIIRRAFSDAKAYAAGKDHYEANRLEDASLTPPEYNHRLEVLSKVLDGEILIHCHSYRADEILMLMNVCKDFGVNKICFQHANEAYKVAPELPEFGASASVFADWWAYKFEVYYSTAYNAAILTKNGVVTSINSDSRELIRHLYHEAAKTQKYGQLTDAEALSLITINPAKQLGIDHRVGSLEPGKDGDVAIFSAHPLSVYAIPEYTIVDGIVRFDRNKDEDDIRLWIDPESPAVSQYEEAHEHDHGCMQDVELENKD